MLRELRTCKSFIYLFLYKMLSKIHLIHCMLNQLKELGASQSLVDIYKVDVKAFLSMAEVSLASSIVLSLEPRTNSLRVRAVTKV